MPHLLYEEGASRGGCREHRPWHLTDRREIIRTAEEALHQGADQ